jgi:GTP-binding protein
LQHLKVIRQDLQLREDDTIILFSAETGQGRDELWGEILRRLGKEEEADADSRDAGLPKEQQEAKHS